VQRHIRLKYACKDCEGVEDDGSTITIAPAPVALIPKSNATEGLLAHIVVSKFADGLPLSRQEKYFPVSVSICPDCWCALIDA
jgi:transposase